MFCHKNLLTIILLFFSTALLAQEDLYDLSEEEKDTSKIFFGFNLGVYFPNNNTADLYTGRPDVTSYGIEQIFNQPQNRQIFDDYFQAPYQIAEYPFEPRYKTAVELGFHMGYALHPDLSVYLDFNIAQLDFEQFFTVQIDDPTNRLPEPRLERFAIIGEENRFNLNIGFQYNYFKGETSMAYVAGFANLNNTEMQSNYIVIDNIEYSIFHQNNDQPDLQPGGIGNGGGFGLGFKFEFSERIWADLTYNAAYTRINLTEQFNEYGLQNSIGIRVIWD